MVAKQKMFPAPSHNWLVGIIVLACIMTVGWQLEAAVYHVGTIVDLKTRINSALPGDQIILSNGVYTCTNYISVTASGTPTQPILIAAQTVGGAQLFGAPDAAGNSGFNLSGCSYVIIQGFYFTHTNDLNIDDYFRVESGSSHCRITRNTFDFDPVQYWCYVKGDDTEVDHNIFRNKVQKGEYITLDGNYPDIGQRLWVHDNYFFNNQYAGGNGGENIRLGIGPYQLISSWAVVENNLLEQADGDAEAISVKSSDCVIRYNTLTNSTGEFSLRSQNRGRIEGNFILASGGIRFYGDDDLIFNNYLQGAIDGIVFGSGEAPQISDSYLSANAGIHAAAHRARVIFNTLVNSPVYFDEDTRGYIPTDFTVANNLLQGNSGTFVSSTAAAGQSNFTWRTNIFWGSASYTGSPVGGYLHINPQLATNTAIPFHIAANSPATNASFAAISEVVTDMDGQPRGGIPDIGADEFSSAPITRRPLMPIDVGPNVVATNFDIVAMPWCQTVMAGRGTSYTNLLSAYNGFTDLVTLSVSSLPVGVSASFNSTTISNGLGFSVLSVTASNSVLPGRYTLLITATSANLTNTTTACLTVGNLPTNWVDADISSPGILGSVDYYQNTFAVKGSGSAIFGTADQFNFVYQPWTNSFTLTARVSTQPYTSASAKSGVMIRESTNANAKYVNVVVQPLAVKMEARTSTGGSAVNLATFSATNSLVGTNTPCWVRLVRSGNTFTGYSSSNGVSWILMAITNIPMTTTVAGLAVVSYDTNKLNTSTFDNVSFQPAPMFTNLSMSADRSSFTLKGAGATNQPYVLQATASLVLPVVWAPLATNNSGSDGAFSFVDLQATNYNQRYYRVATP
ncbi:MAG: chondroitinase-B domain-containing protein [Verrucomicrobiae bacterium]